MDCPSWNVLYLHSSYFTVVPEDVWRGRVKKTLSVHPFETRKEDNSNTTCELTILILSVSVTFSVTFV